MTPREIRRAAERNAAKLARKAEAHAAFVASVLDTGTPEENKPNARSLANRANAQLSSGPKTFEGKARTSLNALKNALTGRTVLLPADDADAYQNHLCGFADEFRPVGVREVELVQSIAATAWRLHRIVGLEMAIYSQGAVEFAASFDSHDASLRPSMIELETFLQYEKQLRNLHTQEARLHRRRDKDTAEFSKLQQARVDQNGVAQNGIAQNGIAQNAAAHNGVAPDRLVSDRSAQDRLTQDRIPDNIATLPKQPLATRATASLSNPRPAETPAVGFEFANSNLPASPQCPQEQLLSQAS
jgi:hypothetical protein